MGHLCRRIQISPITGLQIVREWPDKHLSKKIKKVRAQFAAANAPLQGIYDSDGILIQWFDPDVAVAQAVVGVVLKKHASQGRFFAAESARGRVFEFALIVNGFAVVYDG